MISFFRRHKIYFLLTIVLLGIEFLIGIYVHDSFIRPFVGDYLVVILIYCFLLTFFNWNKTKTALGVLLFSFLVEFLQYYNLVNILGLEKYTFARIVIGTSFSVYDLLCYLLGILTVLLVEKRFTRH